MTATKVLQKSTRVNVDSHTLNSRRNVTVDAGSLQQKSYPRGLFFLVLTFFTSDEYPSEGTKR